MKLPASVLECLEALENAGFATYAVGGCVRDAVLGRIPQDYDLCTAASPAEMKKLFAHRCLVLAGEKHGTVGVVTDSGVVEITTFRTEGGYDDGRHPQWVRFVPEVEGDLARRDFTVNAMAWSPIRGFADPFGGREDLKNGILRAVGDPRQRFEEDALRILRGVRFAVRYHLRPEEHTRQAMFSQVPLMDRLARERVFDELCKLLPTVTAADLQAFAPVITGAIPELGSCVGFDQHSPYHRHDVFGHIARVVEGVPAHLPLRWAALLHDVGKPATFTRDESGRGHFYGHAKVSAQIAGDILRRLKAPNALREQVVFLIEKHMVDLEPDKKLLRRRVSRYGLENTRLLLQLRRADFGGKGRRDEEEERYHRDMESLLQQIIDENSCLTVRDLAINGHDLMSLGYSGREIGQTLDRLLSLVLDESIPNTKDALLGALNQEVTP